MKRIVKITALIFAVVLLVAGCVFANAFFGNPISKAVAANRAEKHLEEIYSDTDFEIERVSYNFKDGDYHAYVFSPSSIDSHFTIILNAWGKLLHDTYEDRVLSGYNTADRISMDYRALVDQVLNGPAFLYEETIGFGDFDFYPRVHLERYEVPEYAMILEDLTLDGSYDAKELGKKHGKLTIYIDADTVTYEKLSEILLHVKTIFDDAEVGFYVIDCVLEYPRSEEGPAKEGRVEVREFPYTDIYTEGLTERVRASDEAARAYYAEQDAEKASEQR